MHTVTSTFKMGLPLVVVLLPVVVCRAVNLDGEACNGAVEINDERADGLLTAKPVAA